MLEGLEKRHSLLAHGSILHLVLLVCWVTFASMETTWGSSQPMVGGGGPCPPQILQPSLLFPIPPCGHKEKAGGSSEA